MKQTEQTTMYQPWKSNIFEWVLQILLIANRQSNLVIYIEFAYINFLIFNYFYVSVFACVSICLCLCIFLLVFVCIYVLPVTSLLSAFVLYLFWLCFGKTMRIIHCFYLFKNPSKTEQSLLSILSLESQNSFSCNLKS